MIESETINPMESLTTPPTNSDEFDLKDLKHALNQTVQQKMVAAQRQIADNYTKNGVPNKQLLLYLVR